MKETQKEFHDIAMTQILVKLAILGSAACAIQVLESPLPRFLPWLKPGLSNALVLFALIKFSPRFAINLVILRTMLSGFFLGMLFSPPFYLSLGGGVCSTVIMIILLFSRKFEFGLVGISVAGAVINNLAQFGILHLVFLGTTQNLAHIFLAIWTGIPSGIIIALLTRELLRRNAL
ncbi:MAG: Gx transporter family protein [Candidatus Riflebacteria bacterium]|nr:Gx transporter family protein [Candidatus Riflebacteria bacterium]